MGGGNSAILFLLSLFFPAAAFFATIKRLWDKHNHKIVLFFSFWMGYMVYYTAGDLTEYKTAFAVTAKYTWSDFFFLIRHTFSEDKLFLYPDNVVNSKPDVYALTLQFLVSRFTNEARWFFAFVSLFYTYFFLRFLDEAILYAGFLKSKHWRFFFVAILVTVPFYVGFTGVRFWTALFVFMIFAVRFIRTNNYLYVILSALSIAFHYTFMFAVSILVVYKLLNLSKAALKVLVMVSVVVFAVSTATGLLGYASQALELFGDSSVKTAASSYTDEELFEDKKKDIDSANWYVRYKENIMLYAFLIIFLLEFSGSVRWKTDDKTNSWYALYVLFFCIFMLSYNLGSLGRFKFIFYLLTLMRLLGLCYLNHHSRFIKIIRFILFPTLVLHFLVSCRAGFYYIDPILLVGNPVVFLFAKSTKSLSEFLVGH